MLGLFGAVEGAVDAGCGEDFDGFAGEERGYGRDPCLL